MPEIKVDCTEETCPVDIQVNCGETCPVPLVETRKALRKAAPGDVVEVIGYAPCFEKRDPHGRRGPATGTVERRGTDTDWTIRIQR